MPSRTLPNFTTKEVAANNKSKSCWVTLGSKVFDVTDFLESHPGGSELIMDYAGKDVSEIMQDEVQHIHSENAYDALDEFLIGFVAGDPVLKTALESDHPHDILPLPPNKSGAQELKENGAAEHVPTKTAVETIDMSSAEGLYRGDMDLKEDYRKHKFLNLEEPLLMQVWNGGFSKDFYLKEVHRARPYKNGGSPPLFGNFLEPLSKTAWWVIPVFWWPFVTYGSWLAYCGMPSAWQFAAYWVTGLGLWTLVEYGLHRGLFHVDKYLPDNRVGITGHFLLHGIHHYVPMDRYRLVMPPSLFVVLATPFYKLAHTVFYWDWYVAMAVFCGGIFGYTLYDCTHYFLHHKQLPSFYRQLKSYHFDHHWKDHENGFGVTSRFWDRVFGTELVMPDLSKRVKVS
ncbi:MAG: hypothetical protein LQ346_004595 [Caloplaca aetnensis]|nr:MAG: hypothetical protein LQ346_004595 [Caloplaca aetnensis]